MRLEDYWGIGPKTSELLAEELGVERAIRAIKRRPDARRRRCSARPDDANPQTSPRLSARFSRI